MKIKIPEKEIEICDCCHREYPFLGTCMFCGRRYCSTCAAIIFGCIIKVKVCRICEENKILQEIVERHAPLIQSAVSVRDAEITKVGKDLYSTETIP